MLLERQEKEPLPCTPNHAPRLSLSGGDISVPGSTGALQTLCFSDMQDTKASTFRMGFLGSLSTVHVYKGLRAGAGFWGYIPSRVGAARSPGSDALSHFVLLNPWRARGLVLQSSGPAVTRGTSPVGDLPRLGAGQEDVLWGGGWILGKRMPFGEG